MIRKAITWTLLGLVSGAYSTLCDATYEAQRMHILILEGPDRDQLSVKSHTEYRSTSNTADGIDFDQLPPFGKAYDTILTKYESTCNQEGLKPVRMATRDSAPFNFSDDQLWTRFAGQVNFGNVGTLHHVFLTKQDSGGLARDIIIRDTVTGVITSIYGAYHMIDNLKDCTTGEDKGTRTAFLGLQSVVDTTHFYDLHDATLNLPLDCPEFDVRALTVHFLTVYYDSTEVTAVKETAAFTSPFQVNYSGGKVYIKVSPQADPVSSIQLYSLTGKRIREIFPTGNTFVWDGASERGIPMPRGLYLMEADGQFVGKVMYTQTSR